MKKSVGLVANDPIPKNYRNPEYRPTNDQKFLKHPRENKTWCMREDDLQNMLYNRYLCENVRLHLVDIIDAQTNTSTEGSEPPVLEETDMEDGIPLEFPSEVEVDEQE